MADKVWGSVSDGKETVQVYCEDDEDDARRLAMAVPQLDLLLPWAVMRVRKAGSNRRA